VRRPPQVSSNYRLLPEKTSASDTISVKGGQVQKTRTTSGYAAAVQPVSTDAIQTGAEGLEAGEVRIQAADGRRLPAYRAMPAKKKGAPVILVVHEIFGVHEHIKDVCRRLAHRGYMAVSANLFERQGDVSGLTSFEEIYGKVVSKVPEAQVMADLDATAAWAAKSGGSAQLGITGFCWGGRMVWLYAAHNPKLKAAVAWYGRLGGPADELHPTTPLDVADKLKAPVLGLYGAEDQSIPVAQVEEMRQKLKAAGKTAEIIVYPGAPHAFFADYRPSYRKEAAEDGWKRMLDWFTRFGLGD
jgi:carboxymethylenebutenolidase